MKVILFVVISLFLLSFDEPDFVKPQKVKKIIELQKDHQANYYKTSERSYNKNGQLIEKIFFNTTGDTINHWKIEYKNNRPIAWIYLSKNKSDSARVFSTHDTLHVVRRTFHACYIFDQNGDVVRYWNNEIPASPPTYKVMKSKNELNSIAYTTVDGVYYSMRYQYKKEGNNIRREKIFAASVPMVENGEPKTKDIEEVLVINPKKEILRRTVYSGYSKNDSVDYSYKYEYYK